MQAVNKMHTPREADYAASRAAAVGSVGLCPAEKSLRLVCIGKLTRRERRGRAFPGRTLATRISV
jgi:hypothetical protein